MQVVEIKETKEYFLVNGLSELNYENLSFSIMDIWACNGKNIPIYMNVIDVHKSQDGFLIYKDKEDTWYWQVFNKPRVPSKGGFMNATTVYNKVDIVKEIPLINMMQRLAS